jgi:dTDP-4-amino-4,6-dideoxygalactose transaminase
MIRVNMQARRHDMPETLAIRGGARTIPEGTKKTWPPIDDRDRELVLASLNSDSHSFGPNCLAFQEEFAAWNGNRFGITTNSGTAALHMAVAACGCGAGDEVIVPAYSWSSSVTCVLQHNAIPVFVDIDFDTMLMDTSKIEAAITEKTKAILVVHLHGLMADMERINAIAGRHGLKVIEDCCQAHGATFKGKKAGLWGDCGTFSCNQNKLLCSGEGGVFVTDDVAIRQSAEALWSFGETRSPLEDRDYHAYALGWMYRNNDLTAAFARGQLAKLDGHLAQIKENAQTLHKNLAGTPGLILPSEPEGYSHNWYNYILRFDMDALGQADDASEFRGRLLEAFQAEGAGVGIWQSFILPAMTVFQARNAYGNGCPWGCPHARPVHYDPADYPVAQRHCDTHACVIMELRPPNGPNLAKMTAQAIRKVMENVEQV